MIDPQELEHTTDVRNMPSQSGDRGKETQGRGFGYTALKLRVSAKIGCKILLHGQRPGLRC